MHIEHSMAGVIRKNKEQPAYELPPHLLDSMVYWKTRGVIYYAEGSPKQEIHTRIQEAGNRTHAGRRAPLLRNRREIRDPPQASTGLGAYLPDRGAGRVCYWAARGRPKKLPKAVEEDLLAEVQRLRAENEYLKNLQALVLEDERRQRRKHR